MKMPNISAVAMAAGLLIATPVLAQTTSDTAKTNAQSVQKPHKQRSDGDSPTTVGPASGAYKQRTDGSSPSMVGPASGAYKQRTQSLSHSADGFGDANKQN